MKTKIVLLATALSVFAIGCNKDDDNNASATTAIAQNDVKSNEEMDHITDDILEMVESQSNQTVAGRGADASNAFIGNCAEVTTEQNGNTWVRTIDFGPENCTLWNGNRVRGKIILTFTNDFDANIRTVLYAFDNFYHNDRHVEGDRTVVKVILPNGHPQATINLDLTVTLTDGTVLTRVGEKVREFTAGYDTWLNPFDNEFSFTGNWTTTNSASGITHTATVNAPVIVKWNCIHWIVSGNITYTRSSDNATAVLDYGDGSCDNDATLTVNGVAHPIHF